MNPMMFFVVSVLALVAYIQSLPAQQQALVQPLENTSAYQLSAFAQASDAYIRANAGALNTATASGTVFISAATLQSAGQLDGSFLDRNYFGQFHGLLVRQVGTLAFEAIAATCATSTSVTPPDTTVARLSNLAQGEVGFSGAVLSLAPAIVTGSAQASLASFSHASCPLKPGQLATVLFYDGTQDLSAQFLFRAPIPGLTAGSTVEQEFHRMHTDLRMGGNNIYEVGDIQSSLTGTWLSQAVHSAGIHASGDVVPKPPCPTGASAEVITVPVMISDNGRGAPLIGFVATASDNGTSWTLQLTEDSQNSTGTNAQSQTITSQYGRVAVFTDCTSH